MKALVAFLMRGRVSAATVAAATAVLALLVAPLAIVSAAILGLVALRQGLREALLVGAFGLIGLGAIGAWLFGHAGMLAFVGLVLWVPLVALGLALRAWRSLTRAVELIVLAGFGLVVVQHLVLGDPSAFWADQMRVFLARMVEAGSLAEADVETFVAALAPWMAGGVAAGWALQLALALFLARGWQAVLYNPGGFRAEFHALRLGRWLAILAPLLLVAGTLAPNVGVLAQLAMVGMTAYFLQGVAMVHGLVGRFKAGMGWLVGFYLLLLVGMPHSFTAVSAAGYADSWLDFRRRAAERGAGDKQ